MPCRDWGSEGVQYVENPVNEKMKKRLDETTRLLCHVMTKLSSGNDGLKTSRNVLVLKELLLSEPDLERWWKHHQEEDRKEAERVAKAARVAERRKQEEIRSLEARLKELRGK